jgi:hypothetical protein
MFGCGGGAAGGGYQGVVVIRYTGPQSCTGGNHISTASDGKTYHVFTASGTFNLG